MSSETSTEATVPHGSTPVTDTVEAGFPGPSSIEGSRPDSAPRDGFHAWHFFVLASILLATVAVIVTRRSAPEHLVLLSFTVGAAGLVAAAAYRMLLPLLSDPQPPVDATVTGRRRAALERDKMLVLRTIKELEFDRAMGKLSQKDFDEMSARLRRRAVTLMKQLDEGSHYREIVEKELDQRMRGRLHPACQCGTVNDSDALFCKKCGTRLQAG